MSLTKEVKLELKKVFNKELSKVKFNYPTYKKHLFSLFENYAESEIKKIDDSEYSYQNKDGDKVEIEYEGYSYLEEIEDELEEVIEKLIPDLNLFKVNHQVFKKSSENLLATFSIENFSDVLNELYRLHQGEKLLNSILSNKYKIKFNVDKNKDKLIKIYSQLFLLKLSEEKLQRLIGKKLASVTSEEDFLLRSERLLRNISETVGTVFKKIEQNNLDVEVLLEDYDNNVLIIKVNDYKASSLLGSQSWCISYNQSYFNQHVVNEEGIKSLNNAQLFVWNFNKKPTDQDSMIGITIDKNNNVTDAHYKDNTGCNNGKVLHKYQKFIKKDYWVFKDEKIVPEINNSNIKRNEKLKLLIRYCQDDRHIYETYDYLADQFELSNSNYLWLAIFKEAWENRISKASSERKSKYIEKLHEFFEGHGDFEKTFRSLLEEIKQKKIKNF
jgi:hypothetical protein